MRSVPVYFLIFSCVCVFVQFLSPHPFLCTHAMHLEYSWVHLSQAISSWAPQIFGLILNLHTEISTPWCTILWVSTKAYNHIPTATISYRAVLSIPSASLWHPWLFATPWTVAYQAPRPMGFSRQEYWMGCHFLLQGIFPTQGLNPSLLHCRQMLYCLSHQWSP